LTAFGGRFLTLLINYNLSTAHCRLSLFLIVDRDCRRHGDGALCTDNDLARSHEVFSRSAAPLTTAASYNSRVDSLH